MQNIATSFQEFSNVRTKNCVYVDKTMYVHQIMENGGSFFLARPRRFGKSLFVSTLKELAKGNRELFEGTWIADKWDWSHQYPVINLEISSVSYKFGSTLYQGLYTRLLHIYKKLKIVPEEGIALKQLFENLVLALYEQGGKVVILIDEYDKPITELVEEHDAALLQERKETLKDFYSVLKGSEDMIYCTFITGVTKYAKISIFSDLNHLQDITFDERFVGGFGYTQNELEMNFAAHIDYTMEKMPEFKTREAFLAEMKIWYNGYTWDGKTKIYNPFGIAHFFCKRMFTNSWFESATPSFLIERLMVENEVNFQYFEMNIDHLNFKTIEEVELPVLLFQSGYLTITEMDNYGNVTLYYPNREVRESMYHYILNASK